MAKQHGCPGCEHWNSQYGTGEGEQDARSVRTVESNEEPPQISSPSISNPYCTGRPRTPNGNIRHTTIDRQEIIRRIKSGVSRPTSPEIERPSSRSQKRKSPAPNVPESTASVQSRPKTPEPPYDNQSVGVQIERPRSALHRGDFRDKEESASAFRGFGGSGRDEPSSSLSTSPVAPWHPLFPSGALRQPPTSQPLLDRPTAHIARARAVSNASLASSFVYKAPTSPLVQASRPDTPEPPTRRSSRSPDKSRRHTFSPHSFQDFRSALEYPSTARHQSTRQPPPLRSEKTFPYQAHQPRRSLNSFASLPHTPASASRRPSFSDSPLQHAAMVGSYEESILRGRMSTTPSKPLNFVAQIGVLGKGNCKSSLRCPPHATVPFPAVFYSYGSGSRSNSTTDQPSPYVGLVDLENSLPPPANSPEKRRQRVQTALNDDSGRASSRTAEDSSASDPQARRRRQQKQKRRSVSPKAPPGGSYRIPQQGQLQIVIKNPNKTAVKLFLVPYDLSDMEPGQKTFIRQRSYSAGPIIDMPLSSRKNLGTDRPEASLNLTDDPNDRPMLRYLIHLHICCPVKGRYFLYKSMRVVFANRVPDGKERLRNEIQLPEPRYSAYKPGRDSNIVTAARAVDSGRCRSVVDTAMPEPDDHDWSHDPRSWAHSLPSPEYHRDFRGQSHAARLANVPPLTPVISRPASRHSAEMMDLDQDVTHLAYDDILYAERPSTTSTIVAKRLQEPFSFGRDPSQERVPGKRSESLLSRKLKDLAFPASNADDAVGGY